MLKKIIIALLLLSSTGIAYAQEEKYTLDGQAGVIRLYSEKMQIEYDKGNTIKATSEVINEIEVLNENQISNFSTDDVYHSYFSQLKDLKAFTMLPNGKGGFKKIEIEKFQTSSSPSSSVFYDDSKKTTVTFPSLVKNARTRTEYTIEHRDAHFLGSFFFQNNLPAEELYFEIEAPKEMDINFVFKGNKIDWVQESKEEKRNSIIYKFAAHNVPKLKVQPMSIGYTYYVPHVIPIIRSYQVDNKKTNFLSSPADLYKFYYRHIQDINITDDEQLKKITADVIKGKTSELDKSAAIYKWVQTNIKYIAYEDGMGGFVPRQAKDVCSKRFGDCKDLASILVAMNRAAGLKAYFTWVGTRHIPYSYNDVPTPAVDNHMICSVYINDKLYLVDGTHDNMPFGIAPRGIQNKEVLIALDPDKFEIVKVPIAPASQNTVYDTTYAKIVDNKIEGEVGIRYEGFSAWDLTSYYKMVDEQKKDDFIKERTSRGSNKYLSTGGTVNVQSDGNRNMTMHTKFNIADYLQLVGDEIYVNLNFVKNLDGQNIDTKQQTVTVDNQFANVDKQVVYFEIPNGYEVSYLPAKKANQKTNHWSYSFEYKSEGNKIQFYKTIQYDLLDIPADKIADHNILIDELMEQYNESIILKKKN